MSRNTGVKQDVRWNIIKHRFDLSTDEDVEKFLIDSYFKVSVTASGGSIKQETQTFNETSLLPILKQMVEFCVNHEKEETGTLNKIKILCAEIWGFESCCNRITKCCNSLIQKISSLRETIIRLCQTLTDANLISLPSTEEFTSKPGKLIESEPDRDELSSNVGNLSIIPSNEFRNPPLILGGKFLPKGEIRPVTLVTRRRALLMKQPASFTPEVPDRNVLFYKAKQKRKGQQLFTKRGLVKKDLSNSFCDESRDNEEVLDVSGQTLCLETNSNAANHIGLKSSSSSTGNETLELISDQSFLKNDIKSPELVSNKSLSKNNIENEKTKRDHSLLNNFGNQILATLSDQFGLKINRSKISTPSLEQSFMKNYDSTTPTPLSDESFLKMGIKKEPDLSTAKDGADNIKSSTISLDVPTNKNQECALLTTTEKMKGKSHDLENTKSWSNHKLERMGCSLEHSGCQGKRTDEANIIDYACPISKDQSMHKICKVANKLTYDKLLGKIQLKLCDPNSEETVKESHDSSYSESFLEKSSEMKYSEYEETKMRSHDYQTSVEISNSHYIINGRRTSLKKQSKDGGKRSAEFIMKPFETNQNQPRDLSTYQWEKTQNLSHELTDSFLQNSLNQSNNIKNDQSEKGEKSHDMTVNQSEERENANNVTNDKLEKREKSYVMTIDQSEERERLEERESKKSLSNINDQSEARKRSHVISNDQSEERRKAHEITNNQLKGSDNISPEIIDGIISMDFADHDDDDDDVDREEQMEYVINDTNPSVHADPDYSVRAYSLEMGEEQMKVFERENKCSFSSLPDLDSFLREEEVDKEVGYIEEERDSQTSIEGEREGQVEEEVVSIDSRISTNYRPSSRPKSNDQGSKTFPCESCTECFQSYHLLCEHITASHPGKNLVCTICSEVFKTNYFLCKHYKLSHADITFTCQLCSESFMRNRLLVKHQQVCHPEFNFKTKVFTCRRCSQNFQSVDLYQTHVTIHESDPLIKCTFCDKVFQKKMYMKIHRTKCHGEEMEDYNSGLEDGNVQKKSRKYKKHRKEDLTCIVCNKIFPCISLLEKHRYTHTDERTVKCETCGKMFKHEHGLKSHQETHRQTKDFACKLCSFTSKTRRNLNNHMFSHKTEKNVICDVCGARFVNSGCLLKHKVTHSDVKPFACDVCGKKFSLNSKMMFHRRIHTDVGRYVCDVCGKRTHQHHNLVVHMRTHTGKKPFECKTCGKTFAHNVSLRSHRNSCIPVRNFSAATNDNLVVEKKASNVSIEIESDANSPNTALNCIKSDEIGDSRRKTKKKINENF